MTLWTCPQCNQPLACRVIGLDGGKAGKVRRFFCAEAPPDPLLIHECARCSYSMESVSRSGRPPLRVLLAGHVGAGKSTYIASLRHASATAPTWYRFFTLGQTWDRFEDFMLAGEIIKPTVGLEDHEPLVRADAAPRTHDETFKNYGFYPVALGSESGGTGDGLIMDMPGERFRSQYLSLLNHAPSVQRAPLVILCVDPSDRESAGKTDSALYSMGRLRDYRGHLAVVATKSDLLLDSPGFPEVLTDGLPVDLPQSRYRATLREHSDRARQFLESRGFAGVTGLARDFESSSFHLVSATSCSPVDGVYPRIAPSRVLEPFIYFELESSAAHAA